MKYEVKFQTEPTNDVYIAPVGHDATSPYAMFGTKPAMALKLCEALNALDDLCIIGRTMFGPHDPTLLPEGVTNRMALLRAIKIVEQSGP